MSEAPRPPAHDARLTTRQILAIGLPLGIGITVGRLAGDAVKESLGYWGSLVVGFVAAGVVAVVSAVIVIGLQRRGNGPGPGTLPEEKAHTPE
jgi:hypothetical protein